MFSVHMKTKIRKLKIPQVFKQLRFRDGLLVLSVTPFKKKIKIKNKTV